MLKPDIHIEYFIKDIAKVFCVLYESFPIKRALYTDEICGPAQTDEFGLLSKRDEQCIAAMVWLEEEHYIRFLHVIPQEGIESAILTRKAYQLLHNYHEEKDLLHIDCIRLAIKEQDSEKLKSFVHHILIK
jgi:hypothetical protein